MKPRKLIITIETTTDLPVKTLTGWRGREIMLDSFKYDERLTVDQIQVNVVKERKEKA